MNRIVMLLIVISVALASGAFSYPKHGEIPAVSGGQFVWDDTNKVWVPVAGTSSGAPSASTVMPTGLLGSATLSIPLASAVALPTAPSGATRCLVMPTQDVNYGNTSVTSGTGQQFFFADIPGQGFFGFTTFTGFRLIGRTAIATATILWY
jgi:hypothetical protein